MSKSPWWWRFPLSRWYWTHGRADIYRWWQRAKKLLVPLLIVLALGGYLRPSSPAAATTQPPGCYLNTAADHATWCHLGLVVVQAQKHDPGNSVSVMFVDPNNAPQAWQAIGGWAEGGNPLCTTTKRLVPVACIGGPWNNQHGYPTVALWSGGRWHTLNAAGIDWVNRGMRKRPGL